MKKAAIDRLVRLLAMMLVLCGTNLAADTGRIAAPDFSQLPYDEANSAVDDIINSVLSTRLKTVGPEFVPNIVQQLRQGSLPDEKKVLVIYLLGQLRPTDTNSVEVLIDNIDLKASRMDPKDHIARWGMYPAEEALVYIGTPSVNPILNRLPSEANALRRHLMCAVLKSVEGKQAAGDQLKERLARESSPPRRANLELSLKEFE